MIFVMPVVTPPSEGAHDAARRARECIALYRGALGRHGNDVRLVVDAVLHGESPEEVLERDEFALLRIGLAIQALRALIQACLPRSAASTSSSALLGGKLQQAFEVDATLGKRVNLTEQDAEYFRKQWLWIEHCFQTHARIASLFTVALAHRTVSAEEVHSAVQAVDGSINATEIRRALQLLSNKKYQDLALRGQDDEGYCLHENFLETIVVPVCRVLQRVYAVLQSGRAFKGFYKGRTRNVGGEVESKERVQVPPSAAGASAAETVSTSLVCRDIADGGGAEVTAVVPFSDVGTGTPAIPASCDCGEPVASSLPAVDESSLGGSAELADRIFERWVPIDPALLVTVIVGVPGGAHTKNHYVDIAGRRVEVDVANYRGGTYAKVMEHGGSLSAQDSSGDVKPNELGNHDGNGSAGYSRLPIIPAAGEDLPGNGRHMALTRELEPVGANRLSLSGGQGERLYLVEGDLKDGDGSDHSSAVRNVFEAILKYGTDEDFEPTESPDFRPTDTPAGSQSRIDELRKRVEMGYPMFHEKDRCDYSGLTGAVRPND